MSGLKLASLMATVKVIIVMVMCCCDTIHAQDSAGVSLNGVSSFIQFTMNQPYEPHFTADWRVEILRFEFRTETVSNSVLFSLRYGEDRRQVTLRLNEREIELVIGPEEQLLRRTISFDSNMADGQWHSIQLRTSYSGMVLMYYVDFGGFSQGYILPQPLLNFTSILSGNHQIYFGASPAAAQSDVESAGEPEGGLWSHVTGMFRGCIRDVYMFDEPVSFNNTQPSVLTMVDMAGARTGCHIY